MAWIQLVNSKEKYHILDKTRMKDAYNAVRKGDEKKIRELIKQGVIERIE